MSTTQIRHYGLLANGAHRANLARARQLLHAADAPAWRDDTDAQIERPKFFCPHCGGAVIIVQTFASASSIRAPPQRALA